MSVAALSPSWLGFLSAKEGIFKIAAVWPSGGYYTSPETKSELEGLKLENHHLRHQVELLKAQVDLEKLVGEEAELLKQFVHDDAYAKRRKAEIFRLIDLYTPAVIGKVIFRETASWSSSFWINLGEKTNQDLGKTVVAKNSPVVAGTSLLGIIEYVGEYRSRVRLITDATIAPSVRILRGSQQKHVIAQQAKKLIEMLECFEEMDHPVKKELKELYQKLNPSGFTEYLAKGELRGMRSSLFRGRHALLQGVGFNYDFEDEEGAAQDLKSTIPLVKKGDILVTTGMDGIFPAGLRAGQVAKVFPLSEGATAYELEALSLIENFDDMSYVTVLPPITPQNH